MTVLIISGETGNSYVSSGYQRISRKVMLGACLPKTLERNPRKRSLSVDTTCGLNLPLWSLGDIERGFVLSVATVFRVVPVSRLNG